MRSPLLALALAACSSAPSPSDLGATDASGGLMLIEGPCPASLMNARCYTDQPSQGY